MAAAASDGVSDTDEHALWVVGRTPAEALQQALAHLATDGSDSIQLEQDEDVLDTWFSSSL